MSEELKIPSIASQATGTMIVAAIIVGGIIILLCLYLGLTRYYNSQELESLIEGAESKGEKYSVTIHNNITGKYSFEID